MDNTTKKVLRFLARIIRWQFIASGWIMDLKSKKIIDDMSNGDFSYFEEDNS